MPKLLNGNNGDSNPGSLDCESGILPTELPRSTVHFGIICEHVGRGCYVFVFWHVVYVADEQHFFFYILLNILYRGLYIYFFNLLPHACPGTTIFNFECCTVTEEGEEETLVHIYRLKSCCFQTLLLQHTSFMREETTER